MKEKKQPLPQSYSEPPHAEGISSPSKGTASFADHRPATRQLKKLGDGFTENPRHQKTVQLQKSMGDDNTKQAAPIQRKANNTGLPNNLKSGIENLSGFAMDDVKVHYNSSKPTQLQAHAYAQGSDIHLAPGQEKHLPHEAWHVVQQKQGRVQPTRQLKSMVNINDDAGLEREADVMGAKALSGSSENSAKGAPLQHVKTNGFGVHQMIFDHDGDREKLGRVLAWIQSKDEEQDVIEIEKAIYKIFGYEVNSNYAADLDKTRVTQNSKFRAQKSREIAEFIAENAESDEDKAKWQKIFDANEGFSRKEQKTLNGVAYDHLGGRYFHISRPKRARDAMQNRRKKRKELALGGRERVILNFNSMSKAADLLDHIRAGWRGRRDDWRQYISSGKFLGMSAEDREERADLKYDKVVLYYDKADRNAVVEGVKASVNALDLNEGISSLYNKMGKGMGIGEETRAGDLGNSFTTRRARSLARWISGQGWDAVRAMEKEEFIKDARAAVHEQMTPYDVSEGGALSQQKMEEQMQAIANDPTMMKGDSGIDIDDIFQGHTLNINFTQYQP